MIQELRQSLLDSTKTAYQWTNAISGGALGTLWQAIKYFDRTNATEAAAAMAYYGLFSLFPLLLALIALGSFLIESKQAQQKVLTLALENLPVSQNLIQQNIQQVLQLRGAISVIGMVGLLWAASGVFNTLAYHLNQAWETSQARGIVGRRLVSLAIVGGLATLLILSILTTAIFDVLQNLGIPLVASLAGEALTASRLITGLLPFLFRGLVFFALYRWVPNTHVNWSEALWGALVAAGGWQLITAAFSWFLSSGFIRYEMVYGSVGTFIALMFWIYLSSLIILFGAHISAAIGRRNRSQNSMVDKRSGPQLEIRAETD